MRPVRIRRAEDAGEAWQRLRRARGLPVSRGRGTLRLGVTGPVVFEIAGEKYTLYVKGRQASLE
jgi:hypothetical protein